MNFGRQLAEEGRDDIWDCSKVKILLPGSDNNIREEAFKFARRLP